MDFCFINCKVGQIEEWFKKSKTSFISLDLNVNTNNTEKLTKNTYLKSQYLWILCNTNLIWESSLFSSYLQNESRTNKTRVADFVLEFCPYKEKYPDSQYKHRVVINKNWIIQRYHLVYITCSVTKTQSAVELINYDFIRQLFFFKL